MFMTDGSEIPDKCVKALDMLEREWPGSSLPQARPAIVARVLKAFKPEPAVLNASEFLEMVRENSGWWIKFCSETTRYELHLRGNETVYLSPETRDLSPAEYVGFTSNLMMVFRGE
jgi:hypothetical protein